MNEHTGPHASGARAASRRAAAYVGSSYSQFLREVEAGVWPPPIAPKSRPMKWSKPQIDARLRGNDDATDKSERDRWIDILDRRLGLK